MALIKWNRDDSEDMPVFSNFFDDFFNRSNPDFFGNTSLKRVPSVNIIESKENFRIEIAAPGMEKKDFKVNMENDLLSIEASKERKSEEKDERYTRREFCFDKFQRSFTLPETVDGEKIGAKYDNGVLILTLPKKEEAKVKPSREIKIS
jgi:HSP20 family protein